MDYESFGNKVVVISKGNDKQQVTVVLASTLSGEFLTPCNVSRYLRNNCRRVLTSTGLDPTLYLSLNGYVRGSLSV